MEKIKKQIKDLIGEQKYFLRKYCLTFIIIAFVTLAMVFIGFEEEHVEEFYSLFILADFLIFSVESFMDFKLHRIPMYLVREKYHQTAYFQSLQDYTYLHFLYG